MRYLLLLLILISSAIRAQQPVFHEPQRLTGQVKVFYSEDLTPVDSAQAVYYRWTYVDEGVDIWSHKRTWKGKTHKVEVSGGGPGQPGNPVPLHGTVKSFSGNYKRLIAEEVFADGWYTGVFTLYDRKGRPSRVCNYLKKWNNEPWSFYIEEFVNGQVDRAGYHVYVESRHKWEVICTQGCYISKDLRP